MAHLYAIDDERVRTQRFLDHFGFRLPGYHPRPCHGPVNCCHCGCVAKPKRAGRPPAQPWDVKKAA